MNLKKNLYKKYRNVHPHLFLSKSTEDFYQKEAYEICEPHLHALINIQGF